MSSHVTFIKSRNAPGSSIVCQALASLQQDPSVVSVVVTELPSRLVPETIIGCGPTPLMISGARQVTISNVPPPSTSSVHWSVCVLGKTAGRSSVVVGEVSGKKSPGVPNRKPSSVLPDLPLEAESEPITRQRMPGANSPDAKPMVWPLAPPGISMPMRSMETGPSESMSAASLYCVVNELVPMLKCTKMPNARRPLTVGPVTSIASVVLSFEESPVNEACVAC